MSDERDSAETAGKDYEDDPKDIVAGQTVVVAQPSRPTGKRMRHRGATASTELVDSESTAEELGSDSSAGGGATTATKRFRSESQRANPVVFVWNYGKQVVAELRKVIWPNRKQMVSYTSVVLVFLAFMVALIAGVDIGLHQLVLVIFG